MKLKDVVCMVEMRKKDAKAERIRMIVRVNAVESIDGMKKPVRTGIAKRWKEMMKGVGRMPKYALVFVREDILWSSVEAWLIPNRFSKKFPPNGEIGRLLNESVLADEVKVIPAGDVETEVERWKLLTEL